MGGLDRRRFLKRMGAAGALGGAAVLGGEGLVVARRHEHAGHTADDHAMFGTAGTVTAPSARSTTPGTASIRTRSSRTSTAARYRRTRRAERFASTSSSRSTKRSRSRPGVFFPAWTYNGRVPGPTIRATEGDRIRIKFVNTTEHPHTIHFHGIHPGVDGRVPGRRRGRQPAKTFTYDFIAEPFGTHLYHCHSLPLAQHIHRGLYGAFIVDPKKGRPDANEMVMVMNAFDTNFDGENEVYALNTVAFAYVNRPIQIERGRAAAGARDQRHRVRSDQLDPHPRELLPPLSDRNDARAGRVHRHHLDGPGRASHDRVHLRRTRSLHVPRAPDRVRRARLDQRVRGD